jgi:Xaa-Pro aminopeptidase
VTQVRSAFDPWLPDFARMRVERTEKLRAAMRSSSLDALVVSGTGNVQYATGTTALPADPGRAVAQPTTAVVTHDVIHVFTSSSESVPPELASAFVHEPLLAEFPTGARELASVLAELVGRRSTRVGFDEVSGASVEVLPTLLPDMEIVDAGVALAPAKLVKTADEVSCIRRAQHLNETAMYTVLDHFRPGVRQSELTGHFVDLVHGLGGANIVDPLWQVTPPAIADGPRTLHGDVAFPVASTDRIISTGDLVIVDTGIHLDGYSSDFGRTWWAGDGRAPGQARELFARWCDVMYDVFDVIAPGVASS